MCAEFGISRPTGYLWIERYAQSGRGGDRGAQPAAAAVPRQTLAAVERAVVALRQRYPDWGARKLQVMLDREGIELTRSTIHRILLRHDLVRDEDRHPPAVQRFEREPPNELWQMDFKGPKSWPQRSGRCR